MTMVRNTFFVVYVNNNLHNRKLRHTQFVHVVAPTFYSRIIDIRARDNLSIHKNRCPETVTLLVVH